MSSNKNETNWGAIFIIIIIIIFGVKYISKQNKDCITDARKAGYSYSDAEDFCSECWDCERK